MIFDAFQVNCKIKIERFVEKRGHSKKKKKGIRVKIDRIIQLKKRK